MIMLIEPHDSDNRISKYLYNTRNTQVFEYF